MKGNTTINMNTATVLAALQMYLDSQLVGAHTVQSVKYVGSGYGDGMFEVSISEDEPTIKAAKAA